MVDREKICAQYVQELIKKCQMPRNQIAALSGLSNPYIKELEAGRFARVRRERLIALAVAVNLDLKGTDELLKVFDRTPLTQEDVPTFLEVAHKRKGSAALLPLREVVSLELAAYSAEMRPGDQVVVNIQPTYCLSGPSPRRHIEKPDDQVHPLYDSLIEAITNERRRVLEQNLALYRFDQYICLDCLRHYMEAAVDLEDRLWRRQHLQNVIQCLEAQPNFNLFVLSTCPATSFTLKLAPAEDRGGDWMFLAFWPRHKAWSPRSGLTGFITDNPVVIQNFKEEVDLLRSYVREEYRARDRLVDLLRRLMD